MKPRLAPIQTSRRSVQNALNNAPVRARGEALMSVEAKIKKTQAGKQQRNDKHPAVEERRGKNDQQDQDEDAAREQPVASKLIPEAGLGRALHADIDKRDKQ